MLSASRFLEFERTKIPSSKVVHKMSKETISMSGCCKDKNKELLGIGGEGCDVEIPLSLKIVKKRLKGKAIMSGVA
jgi:hypothetical protein